MGTSRWSDEHYEDRKATRATTKTSTFAYHDSVKVAAASGVDKGVHKSLDVKGVKLRESRDSTEHPNTHAVAVLFDVTGSMSSVPRTLQANLPKLMSLLIRKGYLESPQIMVGAIGDATTDKYPIQIGQFESGIEIENDLTNVILEGGGGGQQTESYELAMYFMAKHTSLDCFEKRNKKGYLFIVGDEMAYKNVSKRQVLDHIGDSMESDLTTKALVEELKKMYEVYYILPRMTTYFADENIANYWKGLLGQNFLKLEDPAGISELIASTVGIAEGNVDLDEVSKDLKATGSSINVIESVSRTLAPIMARSGGKKIAIAVGASSSVAGLSKV